MRPIFCAVVLCILVQLWASVVVSRLQAVFPIYLQDFNCCMSLVTQDSFTYMAGPFFAFLYPFALSGGELLPWSMAQIPMYCFIIAPYITTF